MAIVAHVLQDVGCSTEVGEQRNHSRGESMGFCHFRRETTHYFNTCFIFALVLLSNLRLQAYSIPEIVAKAKPAIVEIVAMDEKGQPKTLGTGFFVSSDGLVVTNFHVVQGASSIAAIYNNGAVFLFQKIVAQPPGVDLAILQFRATDVPFLKLGKSTTAVEGQKVVVIGNPTGLMGTVADGIISAFRENRSLIQITAPISPGSSGSPVLDDDRQVIGVATPVSAEGQNLNFAIPVEKVSAALMQSPSEQVAGSALPTPTPTPAIDAKGYFDSGRASFGRKEYDKAISDFSEAIRLDRNFADAYNNRGLAYYLKQNYDNAFSDYNEAIRLDPNHAEAYKNRGNAYYDNGNLYKAISDYNEAIRLNPNDADAYNNRGKAYDMHDDLDTAISDYTEAIRLDPKFADAYENRGKVYLHIGNRAKANADFATAKRLKAAQ